MIITKTDRLTLRYFTLEDLDALAPICADPKVMEFSGGSRSKEETRKWIEKHIDNYKRIEFSFYALIYNENNRTIGFSGLQFIDIDGQTEIEMGCRLAPSYWNQGLGTEAAMASKEYGFNTLNSNRIICCIPPKNTAAINIATKIGMRYEKDALYVNKVLVHIYSVNQSS